MKEEKNVLQKIGDFLAGKGFYIVLFACVAVIGVSAWILLFSDSGSEGAYVGEVISVKEDDTGIFEYDANFGGDSAMAEDDKEVFAQQPEVKPTPPEKPALPSVSPSSVKETVSEPEKEPGNDENAEPAKALTFLWPLIGTVEKAYSVEDLVYSKTMSDWRTHDGIDIAAALGAKVMSVADGIVADVYDDDFLGTTVVIDHGNGIKSHYSNLAATPVVKKGDKITGGAVIGAVGTTAQCEIGEVSHLHFAMTRNDETCDPNNYLPKK